MLLGLRGTLSIVKSLLVILNEQSFQQKVLAEIQELDYSFY